MRRLVPLVALAAVAIAGCLGGPGAAPSLAPVEAEPSLLPPTEPLRYVALGDSSTIGSGLPRQIDRWPNQLVRALRPELRIQLVDNLAVQRHGTVDVIDEQLPVLEELAPDLVSLQVGVNDIVIAGGLTEREYRDNLVTILDGTDASAAGGARTGILDMVPPERVLLVTTPDFTLAPDVPPGFGREGTAEKIDGFNAILGELAAERGVAVVDVSPISDLVPQDPTLIADDGLHPSAKQFAGWVELIAPVVRRLLAED
jgi:lysophospholipase L1-like esterase